MRNYHGIPMSMKLLKNHLTFERTQNLSVIWLTFVTFKIKVNHY